MDWPLPLDQLSLFGGPVPPSERMTSFNCNLPSRASQAPISNPLVIPTAPLRFDTQPALSPTASLGLASPAFNIAEFTSPPTASGPGPSQAASDPFVPVHVEPLRHWTVDREGILMLGNNTTVPIFVAAPLVTTSNLGVTGLVGRPDLAGSVASTNTGSFPPWVPCTSAPMRTSSAPDFVIAGVGGRGRQSLFAKNEERLGSPRTSTTVSTPRQLSPSNVSGATPDADIGGYRPGIQDMNEKTSRNDESETDDPVVAAMNFFSASLEATPDVVNVDDVDHAQHFSQLQGEAGSVSSLESKSSGLPLPDPSACMTDRKRARSSDQTSTQKRRRSSKSETTSPPSTTRSSPATTSQPRPVLVQPTKAGKPSGPPIILRPNQMLKRTGVVARIHHRCPQCDKPFARKAHLLSHLVTHLGRRDHGCDECGARFARLHDLLRHQKTVHAPLKRSTSAPGVAATATAEEGAGKKADHVAEEKEKGVGGNAGGRTHATTTGFACEACGVVCKRKDSLSKHVANSCKMQRRGRSEGEKDRESGDDPERGQDREGC
ncbi:hypothetical protein HDU96_008813 [Phlyctochytrium bullatum]|nr:hypothetical protein HDU96_008813 [Phlyctochytrium bullatum]